MMCGKNLALWCCMFPLIASSLAIWLNFTSDNEEKKYSTDRYHQFDIHIMRNYDGKGEYNLQENFTKNNDDTYRINFTNNNREHDDSIQYDSRPYAAKNYENNNQTQDNIVPYKMCDNITCIQLCCPFGNVLVNGKCKIIQQDDLIFLDDIFGYINNSLQNKSERIKELFLLIVDDPCQEYDWFYSLYNILHADGSFYLSDYDATIDSTSYCLANVAKDEFIMNICWDIMEEIKNKTAQLNSLKTHVFISAYCTLGRILLSLVMFIVYTIVPELRNVHGFILRRYSSLIFIGETARLTDVLIDVKGDIICFASAFIKYYTFLGSYFWLNVMCFDIWHTFRQLRSFQKNVKQQKRKKLIIYSVFAWGGPFILTIICSIMEFVPNVSNNFRPNFNNTSCWFDAENTAYFLYYNDIGTISRITTICLCICTAKKIASYEKDIAYHLRDSKTHRYKDNKQWFKLYLEVIKVLFISYCMQWYMYIIQQLHHENPFSFRYIYFALDSIQHFCIFIIFVWKKKIRKLVLKRLGCQSRDMFSSKNTMTSSSTTTSEMISLGENTNSYVNTNYHAKSSFDVTEL